MNSLKVYGGDVATVDGLVGVVDWAPATQTWNQPSIGEPNIWANSVEVPERLSVAVEAISGATAAAVLPFSEPVRTPRWNLDAFLDPHPDVLRVTATSLDGLETDKTAVVDLPPGEHLHMENFRLRGGLVVYSEPSWPLRGAARNPFSYNSCSFGAEVSVGVTPKLGILAPGAELLDGNSMDEGYGLFYLHSATSMNSAKILSGALWILNQAVVQGGDAVNSVEIEFNTDL